VKQEQLDTLKGLIKTACESMLAAIDLINTIEATEHRETPSKPEKKITFAPDSKYHP
jgi:hypothetical protein